MYNIRILNNVISFNFKGFLGIGMSTQELYSEIMREYIFFLSYINGTDSDLIYLESNTVITLSDYINNETIENNIFGYYLYGIKILKLPSINDIGIYYFSKNKNNITLLENELLSSNEIISFLYYFDNLIKNGEIYTIEIAGVIQEPPYSELNKYPLSIEYIGDSEQESVYQQNILVGKTCFINFTIQYTFI